MYKVAFASTLMASLLSGSPSFADYTSALGTLSKTSFNRDSQLAIGDTLDVLDASLPKERCVEFKPDDVKPDTTGAVKTNISVKYMKNFSDFENTLNISWSAEAHSSANLADIVSGSTTLRNFGNFENYLKRQEESAMIVIEASALHGRDFINNWQLKDEYKQLISAGNYIEFRRRCGTHFVRGWNRESGLIIRISLSNINNEARTAIAATISSAAEGKVGIDDLSGAAKASMTTSLADTLKLASKLGNYHADAEAIGGYGIETISPLLSNLGANQQIDKVLDAIVAKAKDFSYNNSAPDEFILVPFPQLSAENVGFNAENYKKLGEIYKALVIVDQRLGLYDEYKTANNAIWSKYFRVSSDSVKVLRDTLVSAYVACRDVGQCDVDIPTKMDGLILSDLFADGQLYAKCAYSYVHEDIVNGEPAENFNYLSSISIVWKSKFNFYPEIDWNSGEIIVIDPEFNLTQTSFDPVAAQGVYPNSPDSGTIFMEAYRKSISQDEFIRDGKFSVDAIRDLRSRMGQSTYVARYRTQGGQEVEETLGRPSFANCPAYVPPS